MNSAEHRTTGDEGEFYLRPDGARTTASAVGRESSAKESPIPEEREEAPAEATPEFDAVPVEELTNEELVAPGLENNFAETEDEYVPPPPRDRGGRRQPGSGDAAAAAVRGGHAAAAPADSAVDSAAAATAACGRRQSKRSSSAARR